MNVQVFMDDDTVHFFASFISSRDAVFELIQAVKDQVPVDVIRMSVFARSEETAPLNLGSANIVYLSQEKLDAYALLSNSIESASSLSNSIDASIFGSSDLDAEMLRDGVSTTPPLPFPDLAASITETDGELHRPASQASIIETDASLLDRHVSRASITSSIERPSSKEPASESWLTSIKRMTSIASFRTPSPVDDVLYKGRVFVKGKPTSESIVDAVISETTNVSPPRSWQLLAGILAAGVMDVSPTENDIKKEEKQVVEVTTASSEKKEVKKEIFKETCDCKREGYKPVCLDN
jgi:hypothetical protein